jgi:hypothetical protein
MMPHRVQTMRDPNVGKKLAPLGAGQVLSVLPDPKSRLKAKSCAAGVEDRNAEVILHLVNTGSADGLDALLSTMPLAGRPNGVSWTCDDGEKK